jgi:hypothetical protein
MSYAGRLPRPDVHQIQGVQAVAAYQQDMMYATPLVRETVRAAAIVGPEIERPRKSSWWS